MAAQRYPDDFDGIVAGAPALNATGRAAFSMYVAQNLHMDEAAYIPASKYPAIHDAVLQACDALDGVKDGVIENPRTCTFDPKVLRARPASGALPHPAAGRSRAHDVSAGDQPAHGEGDLPGLELRQRTRLGHVRRPAAVRHRRADVPVHGVQQPALGLQDAQLRRATWRRSRRPKRRDQRTRPESQAVRRRAAAS